jgi:pantoate kinase
LIKTAQAFAPAAISSFFEICETEDSKPIADLSKLGARGGGFGLQKGVFTEVSVSEAAKTSVKVTINDEEMPKAKTTQTVTQMLLEMTNQQYKVNLKHTIEVPMGAGFGTSAGGALTTGLALTQALNLPLTYNQVGRIAHIAEIRCQTGLGTVSSLAAAGGCILVVEPGAPGICVIDRILIDPEYWIVAGVFSGFSKKAILNSDEKKAQVNRFGKKTLYAILAEPTLQNFLGCCWQFAQDTGFATPRVKALVQSAVAAGAVGAAQNMLGEAVHAVVAEEKVSAVKEAFKKALPPECIVACKMDFQGARLVSTR